MDFTFYGLLLFLGDSGRKTIQCQLQMSLWQAHKAKTHERDIVWPAEKQRVEIPETKLRNFSFCF